MTASDIVRTESEGGQRKGEPRLEGRPRPMSDFLQMTHAAHHRHPVSTNIRVFQRPRSQSLRLAGLPSVAWKAVSLKTIISSGCVRIHPAHAVK